MDFSSPVGTSINKVIDMNSYSITYSFFDEAIFVISKGGFGELMAKIDIPNAFCICLVRRDHFPKILFIQFSDVLCWLIVTVCGIHSVMHYLDDY